MVLLILKGGDGSGFHGHRGRPGEVGGSSPAGAPPTPAKAEAPATSAGITNLVEAKAYWAKHFADGQDHEIQCQYGRRKYVFHVRFVRNHAFTEETERARRDEDRAFEGDRARSMDGIWAVLQNPQAVTWSEAKPKNKAFDRQITLSSTGYGRVILEPVPTPKDIESGEVTHFDFVSWHPIKPGKFNAAVQGARAKHIAPTAMKKALSVMDRAFSALLEPTVVSHGGRGGLQKGVPFNWRAYSCADHCQNPFGSNAVLGRTSDISPPFVIFKALGEGERWITVRPNGPGTEGHAVLIKPTADGAYHVIGGAGGKLNYLKLRGVKSADQYKEEAREKGKVRKEIRAQQRERDRKDGLLAAKTAAREALRAGLKDHEAKFVATVAKAMGWQDSQMRFPEEKYANATPAARDKAAQQHARDLMRAAGAAVEHQRGRLLADAGLRAEAGLGEVPLDTRDPAALSVQDVDPITPETKGFGYAPKYGERAAERGADAETIQKEADALRAAGDPEAADKARAGRERRKITAETVNDELAGIRDAGPAVDPRKVVAAKTAAELLKAKKLLQSARADARQKGKSIDDAKEPVEPKAYVVEVGGKAVDEDVVKGLENDLRTASTRAFLDEVGKLPGGAEPLGRHLGVGAYNAINAVALAAGGAALIDRSVVDVLGVAGAAQILARRLQTDLTAAELDDTRAAVGKFHNDRYMDLSKAGFRRAAEWEDAAKAIELQAAETGGDFAAMQELNAQRRDLTAAAQRTLGQALGEMEANAALVVALEQPQRAKIDASLGSVSIESAIAQARAIGLEPGDYQVERVGSSTILTVHHEGLERLAQPVSREDLAHVRGALDIIDGHQDEDGWLPAGVANRPDLAMNPPEGVAPRLAKPFPEAPAHIGDAIRDYIGGRTADGDAPGDIIGDLLSEDVLRKVGDRAAFMAELDRVAPLRGDDGTMIRAEDHQAAFERLADTYAAKLGGDRSPLHRQQFEVDQVAVDALHRALAEHPDGVAAFKPVGELSKQDMGALRRVFAEDFARADPAAEKAQAALAEHDRQKPPETADSMFGPMANPDFAHWKEERARLAEKANGASMTWGKYLTIMGSPANAYAALQDVVRSKVIGTFAHEHNKLRPKEALKLGRTAIANDIAHLDAVDPDARERRLAEHRDRVDALRSRVAGRYAAGTVADKLDAARAAEEAQAQAQMGLFGADDTAAAAAKPLGVGQRNTIGHAAERQIAGMMPIVGAAFRPGQPTHLWQPTMSGKYVGRQRAVKLIRHNRRQVLGMGVGSGKTSIMLSSFADLHSTGDAKRGLVVVPSVVQGQFHGEALTMLEPGKFNWHCDPGANRDARIAAYKDPNVHFNVVTHQAFRDDMLHLAGKREGVEPAAVSAKLKAMKPAERAAYMHELMAAEGIDHDFMAVDEGHQLLNRAGKEDSGMASVIDGVSDNMATYINATADPVKNDASEVFDVLAKMDRKRYSDRDAFMRRYGVDTAAAKDGLKREMARHFYTGKIDPGVKVDRQQVNVELSPEQHAHLEALNDAAGRAKTARMQGKVDVAAMQLLSPGAFDGVPQAQHEAIAGALQKSAGIVYDGAKMRAINGGAKVDAVARLAAERKGKPGVVFAHSLDAVNALAARLKADGHRVATLSGKDSSQEKDQVKRAFQGGQHDILICSDAGAVGANLQRGQWLAQFDTPQTAMLHAQRQGRINRMGQKNDIELHDIVANHPAERTARDRLAKKYELRGVMTSPLEGLDDTGLAGYLNRVRAERQEGSASLF